jgi:hypothetical protein
MKRGIRYRTKEFAATLSMDGSPRRQNRPLTPRNSWAQDNMPSTNSKASPDGKQLSSLQWKNQVDRSRMEENHIANTQNSKKQTGLADRTPAAVQSLPQSVRAPKKTLKEKALMTINNIYRPIWSL